MNLLLSYDWLNEYIDLKQTPEAFAARLSLSGPGVERLYPQGALLDGIVVGQILKIEPHPQADKLRLATVDLGKRELTLVCGGSNLEIKQFVVVAPLGAKVRWHGEGELVELKAIDIRGVKSEGMICAANEIGLFDAFPHAEREILDLGKAMPEVKWKAGTVLADALGLSDDVVMDIEVTSNRPDAMCTVGMAREASAIFKKPMTWKPAKAIKGMGAAYPVVVHQKKLCPRFMAVKIDGVNVGPSPWWMKRRLLSAGVRPINNVVDITNYVMLELGQPMHVYDADKLEGQKLEVRCAKAGEKMKALDGKEYSLDETVLVVADGVKPVAIAGVMGGEETGVTSATASVVFEAATFDPVSVRRTARALNLYSDSQLRFEKGVSVEAPEGALARAVALARALASGQVASGVADARKEKYQPMKYHIKIDEVNALMGVELSKKEMTDTLERLGFAIQHAKYTIFATVPWWRDHDIESGRDLIEEIARVYGYGEIPPVFPAGVAHKSVAKELVLEDALKTIAKGAGLDEIFSYSFVSGDVLTKAGFDPSKMMRVQNELTADFAFMRTTLLPSMLQIIAENQERFRRQQLFEIANVYFPRHETEKVELPDERLYLSAAFVGYEDGWKRAKGFMEHVFEELGIANVEWRRLEEDAFWHPGRTVQAFTNGSLLATVGELHPLIAERFKFEGHVALIDAPLRDVVALATFAKKYEAIPAFPEAKRDLALTVTRDTEVAGLIVAMKQANAYLRNVEWFDTYKGEGIPADKKSVAFHLEFGALDRTLETKEVDAAMEEVKEAVKKQFGAVVRG
ncbi:MAG: phenylalanine--tRNA ligase subunit beta [bacterium]|nr:phenylalanine--tRNA ligase subunit beta [bacterium]